MYKLRLRFLLLSSILFINTLFLFGQSNLAEIGWREFSVLYNGDTVRFIVKSKKGEENIRKPLFLFCQGSLPRPLSIIKDDGSVWLIATPFTLPKYFLDEYHFVIISKPYVPLTLTKNLIDERYCYNPDDGKVLKKFAEREFLNYYVERNIYLLKHLQNQEWVDSSKLVVAGHSQGSSIATKMAFRWTGITHLVFSGGSPLGRIMRTLAQVRNGEEGSNNESSSQLFSYWESVIDKPTNDTAPQGADSFKADFTFNEPMIQYLMDLQTPVLITYGTKDKGSIFNDYLRIESIRNKKSNFTFHEITGTDHNFFPVNRAGNVNHAVRNWDKVVAIWFQWSLLENY